MLRLCLLGANRFGSGLSGATLQGCLNDLWDVYRDAVKDFNISGVDLVAALGDAQFTKAGAVAAIRATLKKAVAGDAVWIHLSSHGTKVSINGRTHQAVCCYDSNWNDQAGTFLIDDDFTALCFGAPAGVRIFITSDSCYSGNLIRDLAQLAEFQSERVVQARYIEPPMATQILILHAEARGDVERPVIPALTNVCFISGCGANQTSDDVRDSSGAYGAFTKNMTRTSKRGIAAGPLCDQINQTLAANQFTQRPQMGPASNVAAISSWKWAEGQA